MALLVRDLAPADWLTIPAALPFLDVVHLFLETGVGGAPVVDDDGGVVGMIAAVDLLGAVDRVSDDEIDPDPTGGADAPESLRALRAIDVATPEIPWVPPELPVTELARRMRDEGLHRVLVGEPGKLEGVVTTFDLLRAVTG